MKIVYWKHRLARRLAACGLLIPSSLLAAPLNTNLVVNPSFEEVNLDDVGPFTSVRIDSWEDLNADTDENYDDFAYPYSQNYAGFPARRLRRLPLHGWFRHRAGRWVQVYQID